MSKELLGTILAVVSAAGFGSMSIFAKLAYQDNVNIPTLLFFRFALSSVFLWLIIKLTGKLKSVERKDLFRLFFIGAILYVAQSGLFFYSVSQIPASIAGLLLYTYPVLVTILSVLLKIEIISWRTVVALCLSSAGLLLVLGSSFEALEIKGSIAVLAAAVVYAFYIVLSSKVLKKVDSVLATAYVTGSAALVYALVSVFSGKFSVFFGFKGGAAILAISFFCTVVAIYGLFAAVSYIGPSKASIISTLEPLITVILAFWVFKETMTIKQSLGGTLIMFSVLVLQCNFKPTIDKKLKTFVEE